jgi:hypothetical protein
MQVAWAIGTMTNTAQYLYLRTIRENVIRDGTPLLKTRHGLQRASCWTQADKNSMIDTVLQGWQCPPIYLIHHSELIEEVSEGEDHVFDGAHKLEAIFEFMNDDRGSNPSSKYYPITATQSSCKDMVDNNGKYFHELPSILRQRIRNYMFTINMIDDETANDPDRLRTLWERLNKAGVKLNSYELDIPIIRPLIEHVLKPVTPLFMKSLLFPKDSSHRGELEQRLQVILSMSDLENPVMSSQNALVNRWHKERLGSNMEERRENITRNCDAWKLALENAAKVLGVLVERGTFRIAFGELQIEEAYRKTELPFVLGRILRHFPRIEVFRSQSIAVAARLKRDIFDKTPHDLSVEMGGTGRNGTFQQRVLRFIDTAVRELAGAVQPRLFTAKQKGAKLREQGGLCALCSEKIEKHQMAEGDHIVAWSEGGDTTMENLQIVHRLCHQAKGSNAA